MAEKFYDYSSYSYGQNSPVGNIDVGGHFVFKDVSNYPGFTLLLQRGIDKVLSNNTILGALERFTGLNRSTIIEDFKWGSGPEIKLRMLSVPGQTSPDGNKITLDYSLASKLNGYSFGKEGEYNADLLWTIITILHEYVHSGDVRADGVRKDQKELDERDYENCLGYKFEKEVFGNKFLDKKMIYLFRNEKSTEEENENGQRNNSIFWDMIRRLPEGEYSIVNEKLVSK